MPLPPIVAPGPPLTEEQQQRYARHLALPEVGEGGQRRLLAARVAVVGAGGLGSPVLLYLAAAGVGQLSIIDDDVVEISNLQRQVLHDDRSVGVAKVTSASQRVAALNPDVEVVAHPLRLTPQVAVELLRGHDVVVDGSDNLATRYAVADACEALDLPLVWGSVQATQGQASVSWPRHGAGLRDLFPEAPSGADIPSCSDGGVLGPLVGQVGAVLAADVLKLLVGSGDPLLGRVLYVDALSGRTREIPVRRAAAASSSSPRSGTSPPPTTREGQSRPADGTAPLRPEVSETSTHPPRPSATPLATTVTGAELEAVLDAAERPVLLDVREGFEVARGTIPGARHLPLGSLLAEPATTADLLGEDVVVICQAGPRAVRAAGALRQRGATRVRVLDGGMGAWQGPRG